MYTRRPIPKRTALALLIAGILAGSSLFAAAAPVVVTPGSMAGYTYFAPAAATGSGGGSGTGEDVSTLQRCLWAPTAGDQTVAVSSQFNYTKPITLYYRLVGGNGGSGPTAGGGGSTAILLNGTVAALGKGGDAGYGGQELAGTISIKAGDTLRFVTGGGGGDGLLTGSFGIGGGGGAGYMGGGRGGSINRAYTGADTSIGGKGGGTTGGVGGTATGGMAGSNGSSLQGGVGTWPNGSAAPTGTQVGNPSNYSAYFMYYDFMGVNSSVNGSKWPATATNRGAPIGDPNNTAAFGWAGGGGKLGWGGGVGMYAQNWWCQGSRATFNWQDDFDLKDDASGCPTSYNQYKYVHAQMGKYPGHGSDMKLTRTYPALNNTGYSPVEATGGSLPGQIITMYQAPVCGFLP